MLKFSVDKSNSYIEMCEKAQEIQCQHLANDWQGDWLANPRTFKVALYATYAPLRAKRYPVWLPRQDQLQEMLLSPPNTQFDSIFRLLQLFSVFCAVTLIPQTFEQLWLAFVMKEKYNKVWDGRDWITSISSH